MTPVDRSSLLDDAFSLAEAGQLAYSTAFDLASALTVEKDYIPWATASACFKKMTPLMRGKLAYKNYVEFLQSRVKTIYGTHGPGVSFENHIDIRLQLTVLDFACSAEDRGCLESAGEKFTTYVDAPLTETNPISADLRLWVYTYGMQEGGNAESWKTVWDRYLAATDPQERSKLQRSLACIRDAAVLEMYIELAWNEMYVKGQDYFKVLEYISDNPVGTLIVWDYVRVNWPRMVDRFTVNNRYLGNLIPAITKTFDTELKLQEMHDFFAAYPDAGAGANARAQALERVEANIEWVKTYYPVVATWLESFKPGPGIK
ncbi:hypothetical protein B566_EDAN018412 [Ephemera danica]|nr:hypothetical protein B566_EDAN018412 [Ephemera danica]